MGDDDTMEDHEDEDEVFEEENDGWQEGEDEEDNEEEQNPIQKDNVDVTNFLHLLNRSVTPPLPTNPSDTLFGQFE